MTNELKVDATSERQSTGTIAAKLALIGVVLAAVVGVFGYLGGWFTPNELTPSRFVDGFEAVDGVHPGFRRNHARGLGVSGSFESNGNGARLSKAAVFRPGQLPVIGRFSLGGGQPDAADMPHEARGLGLQFTLPDGEVWRTAMVNLPVFPFRTAEAFYEQLIASKPDPKTGKPDPAKMQEFLGRHPETVRALEVIKAQPPSSGFENSTFHSLQAFRFTNAAGNSVPVRWILAPQQPFEAAQAPPQDKNYLFNSLIAQIQRKPLRWDLMVIVGQPGDPIDDSTVAWPAGREQVNVGTLTLHSADSDESSMATDLNFDPLVLPAGITTSGDPILSARSAIYSQSFARRAGETRQPNANNPGAGRKGN